MTYGLQVFNQYGTVSITERLKNYVLYAKGVATANGANFVIPGISTEFAIVVIAPFTPGTPIVPVAVNAKRKPFLASGVNLVPMYSLSHLGYLQSPGPFTFYYNVFVPRDMLNKPLPNYGLAVFDQNGAISYSSDCSPLVFEDMVSFNIDSAGAFTSFTTGIDTHEIPNTEVGLLLAEPAYLGTRLYYDDEYVQQANLYRVHIKNQKLIEIEFYPRWAKQGLTNGIQTRAMYLRNPVNVIFAKLYR